MNGGQFQFEWDEIKAASNLQKHGVSFELASSVFNDHRLLTVADLAHSENEERWFSIGLVRDGRMVSVAYLWSEGDYTTTKIRIISARAATPTEIHYYEENL